MTLALISNFVDNSTVVIIDMLYCTITVKCFISRQLGPLSAKLCANQERWAVPSLDWANT